MQYFVQQALKNTTNAYLAYVTQEPRSFSTPQDFAQRAQLFSATLVQVAKLNAGLTNYFVSEGSRAAGRPASHCVDAFQSIACGRFAASAWTAA